MPPSPAFFDLQVNGYAGVDFNQDDLSADDLHAACAALEAGGVAGILATIITEDLDLMCGRLRRLAELRGHDPLARSLIAGFHIEGPFISPADGYRGAHPKDAVRPAEVSAMQRLLDAANGLTRLRTRFLGEPESVGRAQARVGEALDAEAAEELGLVTAAYDAVDWDQEVRLLLEERASFSPDALTAMEANLRFAGPETMETRIFGRLTAWQNWVFQRPNAVGEDGALKRYGSGIQPIYDRQRV